MSIRSIAKDAMSCALARVDELADRVLGARRVAARQRGHGAEARPAHALRAARRSRPAARAPRRSRWPARPRARPSGRARTARRSPGRDSSPEVRRSFMSVVMATPQPCPTAPSRWLSGMRTSVRYTSLKCDCPEICLMRRVSIPGDFMLKEEERQALVLGRLGIAARHQDGHVRPVRAGRPDLLAVDHPVVAVAHRARAQSGQVRAGAGLGEELAPHLVTAQRRRRVAALAPPRCRR